MGKRFVDTDIWAKEWFQDLSLKHKILVKYIFENCDCAGVWEINFKLASFIIGEPVTIEDINDINSKKQQFEILNNKIFITDFIKFQYGTISENCKPHKPVIEKLKKYGLYERFSKRVSERVSKGYLGTLEEKEQEQEKEIEKDISSSLEAEKHNPEKNEENQNIYGKYHNVSLTAEQYNQFKTLCFGESKAIELIDNLSENIETGKEQPYKDELPNAHFIRLQKYLNYRKKNPHKFQESTDTEDIQAQLQKWAITAKGGET